MMLCNRLNRQLCQYFGPFLAQHELLTFTLIHATCSTHISNLTISEVPQHATSVFSTFVQYITKNVHRISSIKRPASNKSPSIRCTPRFLIFGINCFYSWSILEMAERRLTEKLFLVIKSLDPFYPHRPFGRNFFGSSGSFYFNFCHKEGSFWS